MENTIEIEEDSDSSCETSSSSCESISLSEIERPENYFSDELGEDTYERVKEWLISKCQRYFILHRDRERGDKECHPGSLDRSWKWFRDDLLREFPGIKKELVDDRFDDWGILGMWEDEVFEPWMILPEEYKEAGKRMGGENAMALARIRYLVSMSDGNMTEFVCDAIRETPRTPSSYVHTVEREATKRGVMDEFTAAFNMPAAEDLARHLASAY